VGAGVGEGDGVGVGSGVGLGVGSGEAIPAWISGAKTELDPVVDPTRRAWNPTTSPTDIAIIARLRNSLPRRVVENDFFMCASSIPPLRRSSELGDPNGRYPETVRT